LEEEQKLQEQKEELLHETITEGLILRLEWLDKIRYRSGRFDPTDNAFDCSWLIKWYWVLREILSEQEAVHINSTMLYLLWNKKQLSQAKRWDITYRNPLDDWPKHVAVITRDYDETEWWLWIIDNAPWNNGRVEERFIQMNWNIFVGKRKILIASNPLVEIAKNKWLEFEPLRSYQWVYNLSRYYTPVEWQDSYFNGSYEADFNMNCSWDCTITANGTKLTNDLVEKIASCPPTYPLWTKLRIEDWIEVTCVDRGWSIEGKRLDVWAWLGIDWLNNIKQNKVITWYRNIYKYTLHSKPLNKSNIRLRIINAKWDYLYTSIN
jgi:3D (Asp-Asp-Asp) domain-containing protein